MTVTEAERAIEAILAQLEHDTMRLVEDLRLETINVTPMEGPEQHVMCVKIRQYRIPGHIWNTVDRP